MITLTDDEFEKGVNEGMDAVAKEIRDEVDDVFIKISNDLYNSYPEVSRASVRGSIEYGIHLWKRYGLRALKDMQFTMDSPEGDKAVETALTEELRNR